MATRDELFSAYLDGQLSAAERQQVEALVASDPAARRQLAELRYTVRLLAEAPRVPAPRALTLSQAQVATPHRRWHFANWLQPAYVRSAAALVAVLLVVLLVGDFSLRSAVAPSGSAALLQPATGGLSVDQGDPTDIIGKRATGETTAPSAAPATSGFLGLTPGQLLVLEITLATALVILLWLAWQIGRSTS